MTGKNQKRFKDIQGRIKDLFDTHGQDIEENRFLRLPCCIIQEMKWLADQLKAATKGEEVAEEEEAEAVA